MTRNLKAMGLALLCAFALAAMGVQSASAAVSHTFTSTSATNTILTGTTEAGMTEIFTLTGVPLSCTDISYRGTVAGNTADHIAVVPVFTSAHCTMAGSAITIDNNGCTYTFDSDTNTSSHFPTQEHANVSLTCGHTGSFAITGPGCTWTFEDTHSGAVAVNQNLPGIRYTVLSNHSGGKAGLTVEWTVRTTKATTVGANCPALGLGNPGTHSNATWAGKTIVTCYEDSGAVQNPHSGTLTEGGLVNCGLTTP